MNHRVVSVVSPLGGTGRTTLTAHLATLLAKQGVGGCVAIELSPQNLMGMHLGMQKPMKEGWGHSITEGQWWGNSALENSDGVGIMAFGAESPSSWDHWQQQVTQSATWLQTQLGKLDLPDSCSILLDTPTWPDPLARQSLQIADTVILTLDASARAGHITAQVSAMLASASRASNKAIVITRFDARRVSHRECFQTLEAQWGSLILPYIIHEDENIPKAFAESTSVCTLAPNAQSSHDLQGIVNWLGLPSISAGGEGRE